MTAGGCCIHTSHDTDSPLTDTATDTQSSTALRPEITIAPKRSNGDHREQNDDYYSRAGILFRQVVNDYDREKLISKLADHMTGVPEEIQIRQFRYFYKADPAVWPRASACRSVTLPTPPESHPLLALTCPRKLVDPEQESFRR